MIKLTEDEAEELLFTLCYEELPQEDYILVVDEEETIKRWKKEGWIIEEQKKICPMCRENELEKYQTVCSACEFDERS